MKKLPMLEPAQNYKTMLIAKIFYKTVTLKMSNWCFSKEEEI